MPNRYKPASDTTLAFFRKDVDRDDRPQLESIMISRVVLGEILARIDWEVAAGAKAEADVETLLAETARLQTELADAMKQVKLLQFQLRALSEPDVDYGAVYVEVIDTPTKPPYGTPERAVFDARRCDGCSEPNRCGSGCPDA